MTTDVADQLNKPEMSEFHEALLSHAKRLVKRSRSKMSQEYETWDHQDQVYRGEVEPDQDDRDQARRGKPVKMIVPNTYAQVMTFTSFLFLMYNQNRTFFELTSTGDEDNGDKWKDCEKVLDRDLRRNQWNRVLFQHLLDIGRFGVGVVECSWTKKISRAFVTPEPTVANFNGIDSTVQGVSGWQEFVKYEGNLVRSVSPYRFFPDTNFPLVDFQKGEFCACEEEYSVSQLRELEAVGEVAGVDYIEPLSANMNTERGGATRSAIIDIVDFVKNARFDPRNPGHNALVTKMQVWIVPSKFTFGSEDKALGPEEFPVLYHLWYANDSRVIRVEPAGWWHNEFGWTVAQFTPDMHRTLNLGLADLIYRLQEVISWFVNSHISSVRRVMQNRLIVDPRIIDTTSLDGEKDIYLRKGVSVPLERAVGQLKVQDVTGGHMTDMELLGKVMEQITGVNGNAMGQYNSGRRSAQEARVVTAGASGRMKLHGHLIWESSLGRLGRLMLSNSRQSLSAKSYEWVVGQAAMADPTRFIRFKGTPEEVICGDDFFTFDSTLASEKGFMAQSVQELLSMVLSANPMAAAQFTQRVDPVKLLDEMFYLRGAGNVSRFGYEPGTQPPPAMPQLVPQPAVAQ